MSNPCFELWLVLHFEHVRGAHSCRDLTSRIRDRLRKYNKANLDFGDYVSFVDDAIERATKLDTTPGIRWPDNPGTRVYRVVKQLV